MRVQDVMTEAVQTIPPTSAAEDAWELMRRGGFHHVVVTRASQVVGILSDRDMGGRQGASMRRGHTVEELMTRSVVTVGPTTTVRKAANLMRGRSIGCVVVTDRGRVVGIVTVATCWNCLGAAVIGRLPMFTAGRSGTGHLIASATPPRVPGKRLARDISSHRAYARSNDAFERCAVVGQPHIDTVRLRERTDDRQCTVSRQIEHARG